MQKIEASVSYLYSLNLNLFGNLKAFDTIKSLLDSFLVQDEKNLSIALLKSILKPIATV